MSKSRLPKRDPNQLQIDWQALVRPATNAASSPLPAGDDANASAPPSMAEKTKATSRIKPRAKLRPTPSQRVVARLPVPSPLPAAVAAGRFGIDEDNGPIRPAPDEVRAITEQHAYKLIDMLDGVSFSRKAEDARNACIPDGFLVLIAAYADDFGERAARQLESYVRRQASTDECDRVDPERHR